MITLISYNTEVIFWVCCFFFTFIRLNITYRQRQTKWGHKQRRRQRRNRRIDSNNINNNKKHGKMSEDGVKNCWKLLVVAPAADVMPTVYLRDNYNNINILNRTKEFTHMEGIQHSQQSNWTQMREKKQSNTLKNVAEFTKLKKSEEKSSMR